ncbi:MAG: hypothetical protein JNL23_04290 [Chitinophagaceae bacterium]|nr:hypothetical protein [Chitinophagaceae bacterium]
MAKSFTIHFNYPLDHTSIVFKIEAIATLYNSEPYYVVNNFRVIGRPDTKYDVLPEVKIRKQQEEDGTLIWVHCDSGRPTELSILLGKEIDGYSS